MEKRGTVTEGGREEREKTGKVRSRCGRRAFVWKALVEIASKNGI